MIFNVIKINHYTIGIAEVLQTLNQRFISQCPSHYKLMVQEAKGKSKTIATTRVRQKRIERIADILRFTGTAHSEKPEVLSDDGIHECAHMTDIEREKYYSP